MAPFSQVSEPPQNPGRFSAGNLQIGESEVPAIQLERVSLSAKTVHWAGRQLAISAPDGGLHVGKLSQDNAALEELKFVGSSKEFRLNKEGTLLLSRKPGELSLFKPRTSQPFSAGQGAEVKLNAQVSGMTLMETLDPANERVITDQTTFGQGVSDFDTSSIRPRHTRRAVEGN